MRWLGSLSIIVRGMRKLCSDIRQLYLGQKPSYELLQLSHRLEKGLLIDNPRPLWGWEKAFRIADLLSNSIDNYSSITANAVLSAFLDAKKNSSFEEDRTRTQFFLDQTHYTPVEFTNTGGVKRITKESFTLEEQNLIARLFNSRHSCREFDDRHVPKEIILEAVQLANRCPSACNRQPYRVYVLEPSVLESRLGRKLQYEGDKTIIICGDIRAYSPGELLDWIISPTVFASYLTLSLHSLGVGSCVVRKDLVKISEYNKVIRDLTGMDESEQVILEMFIGYYKDLYYAPVSNRASAVDIVRFIE